MAIVSGELGPGQKIDQDAIAKALGISRLPIREALIELTERAYVNSIPRRGAFVVKLTVEDIVDHFDALGAMFALTARRAVAKMDQTQLQELKRIHEELLVTNDPDRDRELNVDFYQLINRVGSSDRLLRTLQFLALALPNDYYMNSPSWRATEAVYRERLLTAILAHDGDGAAQVAEEHLRTCGALTTKELEAQGYWSEVTQPLSPEDPPTFSGGRPMRVKI
jgi:DNA-binding GntR family transcriptional regulator